MEGSFWPNGNKRTTKRTEEIYKKDFQHYPQLLLPYSTLLEGDGELVTTTDHHNKVKLCENKKVWKIPFLSVFSGWLLALVLRGEAWEQCNTSRELMGYLYPLMYLELMCVIGVHPAFNIYIREHLL